MRTPKQLRRDIQDLTTHLTQVQGVVPTHALAPQPGAANA